MDDQYTTNLSPNERGEVAARVLEEHHGKDNTIRTKAKATNSSNSVPEHQEDPTASPTSTSHTEKRELPPDITLQHAPLLETVLAIPATITQTLNENAAAHAKAVRDTENAEIDRLVLEYYHEDEWEEEAEERFQQYFDEYVLREWQASLARMQVAAQKKFHAKGVIWEQVRRHRDRLKLGFRENGDLDFEGRAETHKEFDARMTGLDEEMAEVWAQYGQDCVDNMTKYIEGFPAREVVRMPHIWTGEFRLTGHSRCLQCYEKKLPCSLRRERFRGLMGRDDLSVWACDRCVRNGERDECCVRSSKLPGGWIPSEMRPARFQIIKQDPEKFQELQDEVQTIVKKCSDNKHNVKVDFFNTHLENFNMTTGKNERRVVPQKNKKWFARKKTLEQAKWYRKQKRIQNGEEEYSSEEE